MTRTYEPAIIDKFVEHLYRRANNAIATYSVFGVAIGLSAGYVLAGRLGEVATGRMPDEALCMLLFGGLAWSIGRDRAFALRARAQLALCQTRIAEQTRSLST
jgi:hypothetical protein